MASIEGLKWISRRIMTAAVKAADPGDAIRRSISLGADSLLIEGKDISLPGKLVLAAVGKAACPMAEAALDVLRGRISCGIVVIPHGYPCDLSAGNPAVEVHRCGHPIPDEHGLAASRRVLSLVSGLDEVDLCLLLLSGGGSSLLPLPYPPVSLNDKKETTALLLESGADITQINTVRKHISAIKGGRLAEQTAGRIVTLIVSDVVGDPLPFIASGPTVADPSTFADAAGIIEEFDLRERIPESVRKLIEAGITGVVPETPKSLPDRHIALTIASNKIAVEAVMREAAACGFTPLLLTTGMVGEAREMGRFLSAVAKEVRNSGRPIMPPACLVAGGETTVTMRSKGRGGRNQELALSAAIELAGEQEILLTAFATDGVDGNTTAAGAWASGETIKAGREDGLDPRRCLRVNDSHAFLSAAGDLIITGPTSTNVNDVCFILIECH
jgi:glycerate-2-kinase